MFVCVCVYIRSGTAFYLITVLPSYVQTRQFVSNETISMIYYQHTFHCTLQHSMCISSTPVITLTMTLCFKKHHYYRVCSMNAIDRRRVGMKRVVVKCTSLSEFSIKKKTADEKRNQIVKLR